MDICIYRYSWCEYICNYIYMNIYVNLSTNHGAMLFDLYIHIFVVCIYMCSHFIMVCGYMYL